MLHVDVCPLLRCSQEYRDRGEGCSLARAHETDHLEKIHVTQLLRMVHTSGIFKEDEKRKIPPVWTVNLVPV